MAQGDRWEYSSEDSLFKKMLAVFETKNAPKGTFGILLGYSWKNFAARYRGEDVISISGEHLSFDRDTFSATAHYTYTQTTAQGSTGHSRTDYVNSTNIEDENKLKQDANAIAYQFNLPNNIYTLQAPLIYSTADFLITVSAGIDLPEQVVQFNIYGKYFHQSLWLGSFLVNIDISGVNVSVSPSLVYKTYSIQTNKKIKYIP